MSLETSPPAASGPRRIRWRSGVAGLCAAFWAAFGVHASEISATEPLPVLRAVTDMVDLSSTEGLQGEIFFENQLTAACPIGFCPSMALLASGGMQSTARVRAPARRREPPPDFVPDRLWPRLLAGFALIAVIAWRRRPTSRTVVWRRGDTQSAGFSPEMVRPCVPTAPPRSTAGEPPTDTRLRSRRTGIAQEPVP